MDSFNFYWLAYLGYIFPSMDDRALSITVVKPGVLEPTRWVLGDVATQMELARGARGASRTRSRSVVVRRAYGCARNMVHERLCAIVRCWHCA